MCVIAPDGSIFVAESHNAQFLDQNPPDGDRPHLEVLA